MPSLEQFPYAGMDFCGDTDLILPLGGAWGELGNFLFSQERYPSIEQVIQSLTIGNSGEALVESSPNQVKLVLK